MTEFLTAAQMRAIEQAAISSGEVSGLELMERAGQGVVAALLEEWPDLALTAQRAVVLCGPGNNGGDGFVVARLLKARGWAVEVFLYGDAGTLPPDAKVTAERWAGIGAVQPLTAASFGAEALAAPLCIDALFGTGLTRRVALPLSALRRAPGQWRRVVAIDIPSGICSDSGRPIGPDPAYVQADLTVTFHRPKLGHVLWPGPQAAGRLVVADIGLGSGLALGRGASMCDAHADGAPFPVVQRAHVTPALAKTAGHKYDHGHALVLSGPAGQGGAARLAARGALRIGAGLVTVGAPAAALPENAARLDAIMLRQVDGAGDLAALLADARINALCLGPGQGTDARARALLAEVLAIAVRPGPAPAPEPEPRLVGAAPGTAGSRVRPGTVAEPTQANRANPRALVLDADALTLLGRDGGLFATLPAACVLTPHAGEFARLFPDIADRLAAPATKGPAFSKVDATRAAALRAGCVVVFKGPDTVIADAAGRCSINAAAYDRAAPWLATAGSGDVLAGMICGLLARGLAPLDAAATAAWLHVEAARAFGPGLIAEDLPEELPKVFRALGG